MANYHRIWEIDFFRGLAIMLMIIFHLIVDLKDFYAYPIDYLNGFWYLEGKTSAILFILLCGISTTLGRRSLRHGLTVCLWAMVLTGITYLYNDSNYIRFGILHFLGMSLLSVALLRPLSIYWLLLLSFGIISIGNILLEQSTSVFYLFPLGLKHPTFVSMDYYPLLPWYGVFLWGIILGKVFYGSKTTTLPQQPILEEKTPFIDLAASPVRLLIYLGRHSLLIYLIHQPILLLLLYLFHRN